MKTLKLLTGLFLACICLIACESEQDDLSFSKKLTKIVGEYSTKENPHYVQFIYNSKKIVRCVTVQEASNSSKTDTVIYRVEYGNRKIKISNMNNYYQILTEKVYSLNEQGYAEACTVTNTSAYEGGMYHAVWCFLYKYTNDGYLSEIKEFDGEESEPDTTTYSIKNKNGNVISYKVTGTHFEMDSLVAKADYYFVNNNGGIIPLSGFTYMNGEAVAYQMGILGKPNRNLVKSVELENYDYWGKEKAFYSFEYTLDPEGYPSTLVVKYDRPASLNTYPDDKYFYHFNSLCSQIPTKQ